MAALRLEDLAPGEIRVEDRLVGQKADQALDLDASSNASWPSMSSFPSVAFRMPMSSRNSVVLPAPLGPSRPQICPEGTEKDSC